MRPLCVRIYLVSCRSCAPGGVARAFNSRANPTCAMLAAKKRRSGSKRVLSRGKRGRAFKKTIATPAFDPDMPPADPFADVDDPLQQML